jgi:hypothetical protein
VGILEVLDSSSSGCFKLKEYQLSALTLALEIDTHLNDSLAVVCVLRIDDDL